VIWTYTGLPAEEVEKRITVYSEFVMAIVNDIRSIESQVGLDWSTASHAACVTDVAGQVIWAQTIKHNGNAISQFLQAVTELAKGEAQKVAVAIQVARGPLVEAFLESGYAVFAVNPKQLDRFRDGTR
jgi:hypothetical protein